MIKATIAIAGVLICAAIVGELGARSLGYASPLVFERIQGGYRVAPLQTGGPRGARFAINAFGMRSDAIAATPASGTLRVLAIGDSITFAPALAQNRTYPAQLQALLAANGRPVEVLNAGVPGANLMTAAANLRSGGLHGAQVLVLQTSFADFHQTDPAALVGVDPLLPERKPPLALPALVRAWRAAAVPRFPGDAAISGASFDRLAAAAADVRRVLAIANAAGARSIVVWIAHPAEAGTDRTLHEATRSLARYVASSDGAQFLDLAQALTAAPGSFDQDGLPSVAGHALIAAELAKSIAAMTAR